MMIFKLDLELEPNLFPLHFKTPKPKNGLG